MARKHSAEDEFSTDTIFNGAVSIRQRRNGYRFSIDALLLAWYAAALPGGSVLDIGAGSGVVSLALHHRKPGLNITAVELQQSLYELALHNAAENNVPVNVIHADHRTIAGRSFDLIISNPPFRERGRGRLNPDPEKAAARHELNGTLEELLNTISGNLSPAGHACLVLLHDRLEDLCRMAGQSDLQLHQYTGIRPFPGKQPNLALVCLGRNDGVLADREVIIWERPGEYTAASEAILAGRWDGDHPLR